MSLEGNEMNMDRIAEQGSMSNAQDRTPLDDRLDRAQWLLSVACESMEYVYQHRTSHYAHHDPTGGAGSGCPACQQERENNDRLRRTIDIVRRHIGPGGK